MAIEFFSLFSDKVFQILHMLQLIMVLMNTWKLLCRKLSVNPHRMPGKPSRQPALTLTKLSFRHTPELFTYLTRVGKEGTGMSYEALRKLIIKDKFLEMCPPECVATARMQDVRESNYMAEKLDVHFAAFGRKNMPVTRHSATSGESSGVSKVGEYHMFSLQSLGYVIIRKTIIIITPMRKHYFSRSRGQTHQSLFNEPRGRHSIAKFETELLPTEEEQVSPQEPLNLIAAASTSSISCYNLLVRTGRVSR